MESNLQLNRLAVYGRYEYVEKSASELLFTGFGNDRIFNINATTFGINYTFLRQFKTNFAVGAQGTLYQLNSSLDNIYGRNPMAAELYVRISPVLMKTM